MLQAAGGQIAKRHRAAQRPHGRQSVKKLMAHGENINSIEVEAPRLFDRMARRFNVDYAFYKTGPDKYLLFFKAGQADAVTACFESYSRKLLTQSKFRRIPIRGFSTASRSAACFSCSRIGMRLNFDCVSSFRE